MRRPVSDGMLGSQVIDALEAKEIKETGNEGAWGKIGSTFASQQLCMAERIPERPRAFR
jgi:hypothetical protein